MRSTFVRSNLFLSRLESRRRSGRRRISADCSARSDSLAATASGTRCRQRRRRRTARHFDLREKVSARSKCDFDFASSLVFVLLRDVFQRKLQVGSGGDAKSRLLLLRMKQSERWLTALRRKRRKDRRVCLRNSYQTRKIITSVDLISAAARSPTFKRNSFAASAVMIEVMCCSPIASVTCASKPSNLISRIRPIN